MFELDSSNKTTLTKASRIWFFIIIFILYFFGLYFTIFWFMVLGSCLMVPYAEEEGEENENNMEGWSDEILFKSGETTLNPLTAALLENEFEPDYIIDLMDTGMGQEDNAIISIIADKKYENDVQLSNFNVNCLKLYSNDEYFNNNYLRFDDICNNKGKSTYESLVNSDSKRYKDKINTYAKAKMELESFLVKKMKKEGWSNELKKEAKFTSTFLYESYISSGLYPHSIEAYNISLSTDYIVERDISLNEKILKRKNIISKNLFTSKTEDSNWAKTFKNKEW